MPNGDDKNWVRLCAAIDGFRMRYGRWPKRVRMHALMLGDFYHIFTPADFAKIAHKVELITDGSQMVADDSKGASYNYGEEGFPSERPKPNAAEWLGVTPKHPDSHA